MRYKLGIISTIFLQTILQGNSCTLYKVHVHNDNAVTYQAASVEFTDIVQSKMDCAGKLSDKKRWIAQYDQSTGRCDAFLLSFEPSYSPQEGVYVMELEDEVDSRMATCESGPYGNDYGTGLWSDETLWQNYGRITAVRQWKSPVPEYGEFLCGLQFRFGWIHWSDIHGEVIGDPYEVYFATDEHLTTVEFHFGDNLDYMNLITDHATYSWMQSGGTTPTLGSEIAFLTGYTRDWAGARISDFTIYQTKCY